ncbi:trehalose-phosphatase [Corynebacterium lizhenjunii]|uniref:Trehalose 6-phosphate phosphatase n=1 Tax=Corynebacterium lizhenjunii TaxID=2709394 RepID=A0A7T0KET1_9CORY|nr:trehalose-phosphatase [Corynebacterium lizhenjunii]QPK79478.1 trehalose-phosphatase [Corynebacterium lizhenjunii]
MDSLVQTLARAPHLAVVSDFDGTLAEFATDPYSVKAHPQSMAALTLLAGLPHTTAAVLSGRHLDGLEQVCPLAHPVVFGGSHGAESSQAVLPLDAGAQAHLDHVERELEAIVARFPGTEIEVKPFQRVLHVLALHRVDPEAAQAALAAAMQIEAGSYPKTLGKMVVEFSAVHATKGTWIEQFRERVGATTVVFLGDDVTDEQGFAVLDPTADAAIKVGDGPTTAAHRLADVDAVAQFLHDLATARADFISPRA